MSQFAQPTKSKKKVKKSKEEKFKNILNQIDVNLENDLNSDNYGNDVSNSAKQALNSFMQSKEDEFLQNQEISINDLMERLEKKEEVPQKQEKNKINNQEKKSENEQKDLINDPNTQILRKQMDDIKKKQLLQEPTSLRAQEKQERQANYSLVKTDMNKWISIIKRNREASHLDFTSKENFDNMRVNTIMGKDLAHPIAKGVEDVLKESNQESETAVKKTHKPISKEQQRQLQERNLLFYKELKSKRVSKIKSKLYHKIKNKKKQRQNDQNGVNVAQLEEEQIKERIEQRHKTKGKNLRNLMKYGDKKSVQQTITSNAEMRRQILQKILKLDEQDAEDYDPEDDNLFRDKAIQELEKELMQDEGEQDVKKTGLKFMDQFNEQKREEALSEAKKLLEKLKQSENLDDIFSDSELEQMEEDEENEQQDGKDKKKRKNKEIKKNDEDFQGRKQYKMDNDEKKKKAQFDIDMQEENLAQKAKKQDAAKILKNFNKEQEEKQNNSNQNQININQDENDDNLQVVMDKKKFETQNMEEEQSQAQNGNDKVQNKNNQEKQQKKMIFTNDELTKGINIKGLQEKYKKNLENAQFSTKDLEKFDEENRAQIKNDLANFNVLVDDNENEEEFMKEKYQDYEKDLPQIQPKKAGWGSWAGLGVAKKAEPTKEELLAKKKLMIENLRKKREDGQLSNVIKRETRNKLVTQYLVKDLPHPYNNKEQYEYMTNQPIGSEWNTMRSTQQLIQPKIKTKVGQIINPIKEPRSNKK